MKQFLIGAVCIAGGVAVACLVLSVIVRWGDGTSGQPPAGLQTQGSSAQEDEKGGTSPGPSRPTHDEPATVSETSGRPAASAAQTAAGAPPMLPSMVAVDGLRAAPQAHLRLSDTQRTQIDELVGRVQRQAEEALSDVRRRQQALRERLAELGTEDTTGAAVAVQKELAGLMAAERQQVAALDAEVRIGLPAILTAEQLETLEGGTGQPGRQPGMEGRPPAVPIQ